jgi:3-phosphoshikimate 1-carboxyvinyltransferase
VPAGRRAHGRLRVPSSKSLTHRYFNLALLSGAPMVVERPLFAEDTRLFLAALGRCGFRVEEGEDEVRLTPEERPAGEVEIFCGNAGTMLRFLVATLTVVPGRWRLDGVPRLRERPVGPLVDALRGLGANLEYLAAEGYVPLRIEGGSLRGGTTSLDAGESSQYLSAILMAALRAPEPVVVEVPSLTSRPYVDVTLAAATAFDGHIERVGPRAYRVRPSALRGGRLRVEGDYSAACYPAAAAALTGGDVSLDGLSPDSRPGDREFMDGGDPAHPRRRAARDQGRSLRHARPGAHPGRPGPLRPG